MSCGHVLLHICLLVEDNVYQADYIFWNANFTESFVNISTVYQGDFGRKTPCAVDLNRAINSHDQFLEIYLPDSQSLQGLDTPAMLL